MFLWCLFSFSVFAQTKQLSQIHVLEKSNSLYDFLPSTTSLEREEWQRKRSTNLGDSLQNEAGVNSASFGPGSGRPVIRGLDNDRIRVLQNGLGTMDASGQSVDHAVPVDTLNTDQVDIVRGPMSLLYGASAVGGVVNVSNQRIHRQFEEGALSQLDLRHESAFGGMASSGRLDYGKNNWMTHIDGSWRDFGDQRIGGNERLNNTQLLQEGTAVGLTKIMNRSHVGFSASHFGTQYGSVAEETVKIHLRQNRYELGAEHRPESGWADKIRLRSAYAQYRHDEFEGDSVGTVFENTGHESRLEVLRSRGDWSHVLGLQAQAFEFSADGDEAYLPTSDNRNLAAFSFHERAFESQTVNFGARVENSFVDKAGSTNFGEDTQRDFTGLSLATGWQYRHGPGSLGVTLSYTERAPTFQELFSQGAHVATGTFETGDDSLKKEKSQALEISARHEVESFKARVSVFTQEFQNFVALTPNGNTDAGSGFPEYDYEAVRARIYGMDAEGEVSVSEKWSVKGTADWVRGKNLDNGKNLPRLSPARVGAALLFKTGRQTYDLEWQHAFEQHQLAPEETRTQNFDLLNIGAQSDLLTGEGRLSAYLRVKNIFDERARNHVSFVKDRAPMPGRHVVIGMSTIW